MHQGSVLSPFLFSVMVDVVTECARKGALSELLYADCLVLISQAIEGLRNKFMKWKEAFERFESHPWENQGNGQRRHHKG